MDTVQEQAAPQQQQQQPETIEVDSIDQFVALTTRWHAGVIKRLEHFLKMPDDPNQGIEMQVGDEPSIKLTGDALKGMKAGIQLALMEFGNLPFAYELEDAANDPQQSSGG